MIFKKKKVNIKFKKMTRFAVGALNIVCTGLDDALYSHV